MPDGRYYHVGCKINEHQMLLIDGTGEDDEFLSSGEILNAQAAGVEGATPCPTICQLCKLVAEKHVYVIRGYAYNDERELIENIEYIVKLLSL